jgi:hypothetical protein
MSDNAKIAGAVLALTMVLGLGIGYFTLLTTRLSSPRTTPSSSKAQRTHPGKGAERTPRVSRKVRPQ